MTSAFEARVPAAVGLSLALHVGGAAGWVRLNAISRKGPTRVIGDVELLVPVRRAVETAQAPRAAPAKPPPTTWNFLKLALPSMPAAAPLEVRTPEASKPKPLADIAKLEPDRGRMQRLKPLEALDLGRRRIEAAWLDVGRMETSRRAVPAELPKIEEVGSRRAPRALIAMAALAEEERGRLEPLKSLAPAAPEPKASRRAVAPVGLPDEERPRRADGALARVARALATEALLAPPRPMEAPAPRGRLEVAPSMAPSVPAKAQAVPVADKKKAVEIEGPLADRKVVYSEVPPFPSWGPQRGLLEAEVRIRFTVGADGAVLPGMRVEHTSGFGALDRSAMDALKRWRFEPVAGRTGSQWGIITFRFVAD